MLIKDGIMQQLRNSIMRNVDKKWNDVAAVNELNHKECYDPRIMTYSMLS